MRLVEQKEPFLIQRTECSAKTYNISAWLNILSCHTVEGKWNYDYKHFIQPTLHTIGKEGICNLQQQPIA